MAKSKGKSKVDDEDVDQVAVDDDADVDVEEVAEADVDADADFGELDADADDGDADHAAIAVGGDDDDGPAPSVDERPKPPKPRLTKTQWALVLLNWVMAPLFLIAAAMDYKTHVDYAYRTILNYIQIVGLPLKEEEDGPSMANQTRPLMRLDADMLAKEYKKRPGVVKTFSEKFAPVEEPMPIRLRPSDITEQMKLDVFRGLADPVATLEDEIERLKTDLPKRIADAADEVLRSAKDDDAKKDIVHKSLFPIVGATQLKDKSTKEKPFDRVWVIDQLNEKLAKASGAELDTWVKDSVQRRLYYDILAPLNIFRPGDVKKFPIERLGDQDVTIDEIKGYLIERLNGTIAEVYDPKVHIGPDYFAAGVKRDSIEKRHKIAFLLFTLGQVDKPVVNKRLIDKGVERAQTISGLYEFTNAAVYFVRSLAVLEGRLETAARDDRIGVSFKTDGPPSRTEGFIDEYERRIDQLVRLAANLENAQKRLADLNNRKNEFQVVHDERTKQYTKALEKLRKERASTAKYVQGLRALQNDLHQALKELSNAAERNLQLVDEITDYETRINARFAPKGGKK